MLLLFLLLFKVIFLNCIDFLLFVIGVVDDLVCLSVCVGVDVLF